MFEGRSQTVANVAGLFDANPFGPAGLGDLAEVRVHEVRPEGDEAGLLLLDVHEVEHAVVEDDVDDGRPTLNFGQQVAHAQAW